MKSNQLGCTRSERTTTIKQYHNNIEWNWKKQNGWIYDCISLFDIIQ